MPSTKAVAGPHASPDGLAMREPEAPGGVAVLADGVEARAPQRRRHPTINDVAVAAEVAIGTVSRYLNGLSVRRGNRDQIEAAIARLGYRRSALARAMKTDKTHIVGLLVPSFDEFHAQLLEVFARSVRRTGRALLTYGHSNEVQTFREALDFFRTQRVDALVMDATWVAYDLVEELADQRVPIVFYNNVVAGLAADTVTIENHRASYRAVRHLTDLGHRHIAALTGDLRDSTARERLSGYEAALRDGGIATDPRYLGPGDWHAERTYLWMKSLMGLPEPPTALFAANYQIAIGALTWLKEQGRRVPDDLSLVCFDDVALFRLHEAGITAVAQPMHRIADSITDIIAHRLSAAHDHSPQAIVHDCDIILRGSTRRPS